MDNNVAAIHDAACGERRYIAWKTLMLLMVPFLDMRFKPS